MSSRPWMPLYVADFQCDTLDLDADEVGVYMILLMLAWRREDAAIPNDMAWLKRSLKSCIAKFHGHQFNRIVPAILKRYFELGEDNKWRNRRLLKERHKADKLSAKQKQNADKRWAETNENKVIVHPSAMPSQSQPQSEEKKEDRPKRVRTPCSATFEEFWKAYPRTPNMSKKEAWRVWQKLSEEDQSLATTAVPKYSAWLKSKPDHPVVHACRFLSQRRFDGFNEPEPTNVVPIGFYAAFGSAQLDAWDAHNRKIKGINMPRDSRGGWLCAAEWPPGYEPQTATG